MSKAQIRELLREAECQCLLWELQTGAEAERQLAKWEAEYAELESTL